MNISDEAKDCATMILNIGCGRYESVAEEVQQCIDRVSADRDERIKRLQDDLERAQNYQCLQNVELGHMRNLVETAYRKGWSDRVFRSCSQDAGWESSEIREHLSTRKEGGE